MYVAQGSSRYHFRVERAKRAILREALADAWGNRTRAAAALGLNRTHLLALMKRHRVT